MRIAEIANAQGGVTVQVQRTPLVSRPNVSRGNTQVVKSVQVDANLENGKMHHLPTSANLNDVVTALDRLGTKPRD